MSASRELKRIQASLSQGKSMPRKRSNKMSASLTPIAFRYNANGLTYISWLRAAGYTKSAPHLIKAWERGEDPSDYRAER